MDNDQQLLGQLIAKTDMMMGEIALLRKDVTDIKEGRAFDKGKVWGISTVLGVVGGFVAHTITKFFN